MDGAHAFVERKIAESVKTREQYWKRDLSSRAAYEKSVERNRRRLREIIGVVDPRVPVRMERFGDDGNSGAGRRDRLYRVVPGALAGARRTCSAKVCCWNRSRPAYGHVVALPDADQTPEQICGLAPGIAPAKQFARRLAENGFDVVVPTLVDRSLAGPGHPDIRMTDQPHREWIYRQAFQMGRHVIGYEVQKVLAAVDWFERTHGGQGGIGVAGYGEGGLIAFYAAAVDTRIDAALVSGYFDSRQDVWSEPIYRNVWSLLREFGDAEIATLIAPRGLVIEYSRVPDIQNPRGDLKTPKFEAVRDEFDAHRPPRGTWVSDQGNWWPVRAESRWVQVRRRR